MSALAHARCFNHAGREAVARCPSCRHFYCRECVAEHEHRLLCAKCIQQLLQDAGPRKRQFLGPLVLVGRLVASILVLWVVFLLYGQFLLLLPSEFHGDAEAVQAVDQPS